MQDVPIKHAATVVLVSGTGTARRVLLGRRNPNSAFLPNKFVFPGGGVEPEDAQIVTDRPFDPICQEALNYQSDLKPEMLGIAALRELFEETGLECSPRYNLGALRFIFRALTPKGLPRRFDTRFFLLDAGALGTDPEDFAPQDHELLDLGWYGIDEALALEMIPITRFVLELLKKPLSATHIPWQVASLDLRDQRSIPRRE